MSILTDIFDCDITHCYTCEDECAQHYLTPNGQHISDLGLLVLKSGVL